MNYFLRHEKLNYFPWGSRCVRTGKVFRSIYAKYWIVPKISQRFSDSNSKQRIFLQLPLIIVTIKYLLEPEWEVFVLFIYNGSTSLRFCIMNSQSANPFHYVKRREATLASLNQWATCQEGTPSRPIYLHYAPKAGLLHSTWTAKWATWTYWWTNAVTYLHSIRNTIFKGMQYCKRWEFWLLQKFSHPQSKVAESC